LDVTTYTMLMFTFTVCNIYHASWKRLNARIILHLPMKGELSNVYDLVQLDE